MQLSEEIQENYGDNNSEFARRIGDSPQNVQRYRLGFAIPRPEKMARIFEITEGRVQPNDFYAAYIRRFKNRLLISGSELAMQIASLSAQQPGQGEAA
jgi:transcriptional regulator with XRE-family HTH domain